MVTGDMSAKAADAADALVANAHRYRAEVFRPGAPKRPRAGVAVVTCMDARINVPALLGLRDGDAHILRNAGGVVTDDVVRSLSISQRLLSTTKVMLIMHSGCGLRDITDEEFSAEVQAEVGLRPTWRAEAFADPAAEVQHGVERLRRSPFLSHAGDVRGFLYDESTGTLAEVG